MYICGFEYINRLGNWSILAQRTQATCHWLVMCMCRREFAFAVQSTWWCHISRQFYRFLCRYSFRQWVSHAAGTYII